MGKIKGPNIFAIIVTYNAMQWIERCLGSLRHSSIPITTVIIDNCSSDGTIDYITTHFSEVTLFAQEKNLGFGQANNIGIKYALQQGCTHILLLNQDAWIEKNMLASLLHYDDGNSLLSPIHLTGDGKKIDRNFEHNAIGRSKEFLRYQQDITQGKYAKYATYEINAACWLLPRKVLENIGGFSPLFFHYAEDTDYLQRLHYHKKGVYFVSGTHCNHDREHVPPKTPSQQSIYQQMVLRAVDINYSPFFCFLHRLRYDLAVWHNAILAKRLKDIQLLYRAKASFYKNYSEITFNRHIIQTIGPHWLQ